MSHLRERIHCCKAASGGPTIRGVRKPIKLFSSKEITCESRGPEDQVIQRL